MATAAKKAFLPVCIDLHKTFGNQYRVKWEADGTTRTLTPRSEHCWLREIPGRYGGVYPFSSTILAAWSNHPRISARLRRLPFVLAARGTEEAVIHFDPADAERVFQEIKAYKRMQMSPEEKERRTKLLEKMRIRNSNK